MTSEEGQDGPGTPSPGDARGQGRWSATALACALLGFLLLMCLWSDLDYLFQSPYPYGVDGYYYVAQVEGLLEEGRLLREAPPLTFLAIRALAVAVPVTVAVKLAGIAFLTLAALLCLVIVHRLTDSPLAAVLGFVLVFRGFMREELLVDFVKQSFGHCWVFLVFLCLLGYMQTRNKAYLAAVAGGLAGAYLTHPLAASLGLLAVCAAAGFALLLRRRPDRGAFGFSMAGLFAVWATTLLLASNRLPLSKELLDRLRVSFTTTPHLNLDSMRDSLGSVQPALPLALIMTVLLFAAFAVGWTYAPAGTVRKRALVFTAAVLTPCAALAYSPFLVPASQNDMAMHLRLIAALAIPAGILIPAALTAAPLHRHARSGLLVSLIVLFGAAPAFRQGFPGPPGDGGLLHEAMVDTRHLIPEDAVIIAPSLRVANMVSALWRRPRRIATPYDSMPRGGSCYRLLRLEPEFAIAFAEFTREQTRYPSPVVILGPWILVDESLYQEFRRYRRNDARAAGLQAMVSTSGVE